ncbi:hypothetical protein IJI00_00175 [Candidatus Saccharibacteria bacterium]|nr:hypothetical protein [Candidatus Saccharibacteria bacterium]
MKTAGARLVILGVMAIMIAVATTGVSLAVYHNSGDIYLDRSRPGFLPDEEEIDSEIDEDEYDFDENSMLTKENLDEYLEKLDGEIKAVDAYQNPFAADALSDEKLGI